MADECKMYICFFFAASLFVLGVHFCGFSGWSGSVYGFVYCKGLMYFSPSFIS